MEIKNLIIQEYDFNRDIKFTAEGFQDFKKRFGLKEAKVLEYGDLPEHIKHYKDVLSNIYAFCEGKGVVIFMHDFSRIVTL